MSWGSQLPSDKSDYDFDDWETMCKRLDKCSENAIGYFRRIIKPSGQVGNETDLGSYAKLPNGLIMAGYPKEANLVIDYCLKSFFDKESGDFLTVPQIKYKSASKPFEVFYPYTNQWLLQAGLKLRRFDFVFKAAEFMDKFYNPKLHMQTILKPYDSSNKGNVHCIFNSAALGATYLYLNRVDRAVAIGDAMVSIFEAQRENMINSKSKVYYLRFNDDLEFFKNVKPAKGERLIYKVVGTQVKQAWFAIGYPTAFMGLLYEVTKDDKYLKCGEFLLDYAINHCNEDVRNNQWAHKLMWGASVIGRITNKKEYWTLCFDIANTIMNGQEPTTGVTSGIIDQTAEMTFWTPIISMNIRRTVNRFGSLGTGIPQSKL